MGFFPTIGLVWSMSIDQVLEKHHMFRSKVVVILQLAMENHHVFLRDISEQMVGGHLVGTQTGELWSP